MNDDKVGSARAEKREQRLKLMREIEAMGEPLEKAPEGAAAAASRQRIADKRLLLALRLERLRATGAP